MNDTTDVNDTMFRAAKFIYDLWLRQIQEARSYGMRSTELWVRDTNRTVPNDLSRFFTLLNLSRRDCVALRAALTATLRAEGFEADASSGNINIVTAYWR